MTRLHRIDPKMGWHHVTNHVAGEGDLFLKDDDRHLFMRLLASASARSGVQIAGFCLMGNHFHLILHCPDGRLSEFMQLVESVYARYFITQRGYRGPVFVDRFHNTIITSDEQLLVTARYVDRNGLELGLDIAHYAWSSFPTHVTGSGNHALSISRSCDLPVRLAGGASAYRTFVCTDGQSDKFSLRDGHRVVPATPFVPIEELLIGLAAVALSFAGAEAAPVTESRSGARSDARLAAVFVAHNSRAASVDELCEFFGYAARSSLSSAITRASRRLETHLEFRALVESIDFTWRDSPLRQAS
jgi:putative transposase